VKQLFLIPIMIFVFLTVVNAEPLYKCVDTSGNEIITTLPQDGMNCASATPGDDPSDSRRASKSKSASSENLVEICNNLFAESEDISNEIKSFEPRLSELQKEQFEIRQGSVKGGWGYDTEQEKMRPVNEERNKINQQISLLYQKNNLIQSDINRYKCEQLRNDLSRLNHGSSSAPSYAPSPSGSNRTIIMRDRDSSVIIRNRN
jgi:chromosome segregation ATPase